MFQQGRIFTSSPASQPDDTYNLIIILVPGLSCGSENFLQRNWAERDWRRRFRNEAGQREARLTATWYFQKRKWVRISSEMKGLTQTVWDPRGWTWLWAVQGPELHLRPENGTSHATTSMFQTQWKFVGVFVWANIWHLFDKYSDFILCLVLYKYDKMVVYLCCTCVLVHVADLPISVLDCISLLLIWLQ